MDVIATSLIKNDVSLFSPISLHAHLVNLSSDGAFPTNFKQASVTSLIKGHFLDKLTSSNNRPVSNLMLRHFKPFCDDDDDGDDDVDDDDQVRRLCRTKYRILRYVSRYCIGGF